MKAWPPTVLSSRVIVLSPTLNVKSASRYFPVAVSVRERPEIISKNQQSSAVALRPGINSLERVQNKSLLHQ